MDLNPYITEKLNYIITHTSITIHFIFYNKLSRLFMCFYNTYFLTFKIMEEISIKVFYEVFE